MKLFQKYEADFGEFWNSIEINHSLKDIAI